MDESDREHFRAGGRWTRTRPLGFDRVVAWDGRSVRTDAGLSVRPRAEDVARLDHALHPPEATGVPTKDAAALGGYVRGPWSPQRAAALALTMAAAGNASDLHAEPAADHVALRLRRQGVMEPWCTLDVATGRRLLAAWKHLAGCLPYRSDLVQEGRIPRPGVAADVRAAFLPTALGERAAFRLFGKLRTVAALGFSPTVEGAFLASLDARAGLLLVAGPSGAGKTTTIYAALSHLAGRRGGAHLSIEDPVEQRLRLAGVPVDQVELAPQRGLTADGVLAGALRQDVDVIALGEIRTRADVRLALEAAHTGRLVLAGLHAGSLADARQRLLDLEAEPTVLAATLRGVLHQRLQVEACPCGASCALCGGTGRLLRPEASFSTLEGSR